MGIDGDTEGGFTGRGKNGSDVSQCNVGSGLAKACWKNMRPTCPGGLKVPPTRLHSMFQEGSAD